MEGITYAPLAADEVDAAFELERQAFPPEEAATLDKLRYRQAHAPDLFLGAYTWRPPSVRRLVGYICSTAAQGDRLTHGSMDAHDPEGTTVCIHSVVVDPTLRGRGLGESMVRQYIRRLRGTAYERVNLLAHAPLVPLYQRAGLELLGRSEVVHGPDPWLELSAALSATDRSSPGIPFSSLSKRRDLLTEPSVSEKDEKALHNALPLYCPRRQCRSLILQRGCARWDERPLLPVCDPAASCPGLSLTQSVQLADPRAAPTPSPPDFPPEVTTEAGPCWSVLPPSPMTFENISVSKPVPGSPNLKYLGCADCDCGPLGYIGPHEAILDAARLRYRVVEM